MVGQEKRFSRKSVSILIEVIFTGLFQGKRENYQVITFLTKVCQKVVAITMFKGTSSETLWLYKYNNSDKKNQISQFVSIVENTVHVYNQLDVC